MRKGLIVVAALGLSVALAACGGGSSTNVSSKSSKKAATPTTAPTPATVSVANTSLGMVLVASNGRTLYELDKDTPTMSNCTGGCASLWPALTATGTPTAGPGVDATKLTILNGPNGMQVVYNGHPLYTFAMDMAAGDVKGQGFAGNIWHVISPTGMLITTPTTMAGSTPSTAATGGGSGSGSGGTSHGGYGY